LIKEGRKHGETQLDGTDGADRILHEGSVLRELGSKNVSVPKVYGTFSMGQNSYLVLEEMMGRNMQQMLGFRKKKIRLKKTLNWGRQIAAQVATIHQAGWVWRDCKPGNFLILRGGLHLRPFDFEGACRSWENRIIAWGTPGYVPPEPLGGRTGFCEDLYSLGATLYQLLTGPPPPPKITTRMIRRIPKKAQSIVSTLVEADQELRPSAKAAAEILEDLCNTS